MGTNGLKKGIKKGINPTYILVSKIPFSMRIRIFSLLTLLSLNSRPKMAIQRVNSITLDVSRAKGIVGLKKGINPLVEVGYRYPPLKGIPFNPTTLLSAFYGGG